VGNERGEIMKRLLKRIIVGLCVLSFAAVVCLLVLLLCVHTESVRKSPYYIHSPFNSLPPLSPNEIDIFGVKDTQVVPIPVSEDIFLEALKGCDLDHLVETATLTDFLERFGEPLRFYDYNGIEYTREHLPMSFRMDYPAGFVFHIYEQQLFQIDLTSRGHLVTENLQVGSSFGDVLSVFGELQKVIDKSGKKFRFPSGWSEESSGSMYISDHLKLYLPQNHGIAFVLNRDTVTKIQICRIQAFKPVETNYVVQPETNTTQAEGNFVLQPETNTIQRYFKLSSAYKCKGRLEQLGQAFLMYTNESKGERYPLLSSQPGCFMFNAADIFPKYANDTTLLCCPALKGKKTSANSLQGMEYSINDESYWYFGFSIFFEREALAFLAAYNDAMENQLEFDDKLSVPYRAKAGTLGQVVNLSAGVGRFYVRDIGNPAAFPSVMRCIPLLVERPNNHGGNGGHVLYLDGHVEWLPYPGPFPMTQSFIEGLIALEEKWEGEQVGQ
jgi:prepilin-type processing-associated H-X9-DG protein